MLLMEENFGVKVITFGINRNVFIDPLRVVNFRAREGWSVCLSSPDGVGKRVARARPLWSRPKKVAIWRLIFYITNRLQILFESLVFVAFSGSYVDDIVVGIDYKGNITDIVSITNVGRKRSGKVRSNGLIEIGIRHWIS